MIRTAVFALSFLMNLRFKQVNDVPRNIQFTMEYNTRIDRSSKKQQRQQKQQELSRQTVKAISSKKLGLGSSCNIHQQHSEKGRRQNRMEEKPRYLYQYHHNFLSPPLPPNSYRLKRLEEESREKETQKLNHTLIILVQISTSNLKRHSSRMQGFKVNKSAVEQGQHLIKLVYAHQVSRTSYPELT